MNSLRKIKEKYRSVKITTDYGEVIKDKEVDAIVIATSTSTHIDLDKKALEAEKCLRGKAVRAKLQTSSGIG